MPRSRASTGCTSPPAPTTRPVPAERRPEDLEIGAGQGELVVLLVQHHERRPAVRRQQALEVALAAALEEEEDALVAVAGEPVEELVVGPFHVEDGALLHGALVDGVLRVEGLAAPV